MGPRVGTRGQVESAHASFYFSTISSGLNAIAAVVLQDVIYLYIAPKMTESVASIVVKVLGECTRVSRVFPDSEPL